MAMSMGIAREQVQKRERDRDFMFQVMMGNMMMARHVEAERREEEMLQKAIEESRRMADPSQLNPDDMSYEQLLQLQE